jgi:hypothetical protein
MGAKKERRSDAFAVRLGALAGPTGMNVILKLSAFPPVCIGVQIFWDGASQLLTSMPLYVGDVFAKPASAIMLDASILRHTAS